MGLTINDFFISDGFVFHNPLTDRSGCCSAGISSVGVAPTSALHATKVLAELMAAPKDTEWHQAKATLRSAMIAQIVEAVE